MRTVLTLLVRDEIDIIETNIRYHLENGVDYIVATDNRSVDGTTDVLRRYEAMNLLHYTFEPADDYDQTTWVTRMARFAADELDADWVINCDADEFWWPMDGSIGTTLGRLPRTTGYLRVPRVNFVPRPATDEPALRTMTVRDVVSRNTLGHPLPPKVCHRAHPRVTVNHGNHSILGTELMPHPGPSPLLIFHFPLRSYQQFERRIALGGAAFERNKKAPPDVGVTWRTLYERYREGGLPGWYADQVYSDDRIAAGVTSGDLIRDTRLLGFLDSRSIPLGTRRAPTPTDSR